MRRAALRLGLLALAAGLMAVAVTREGAEGDVRAGGTFRVAFWSQALDYVDPALSYGPEGWALLDTTCARLMSYADKPSPEGFRIAPEVAAGYPRVSPDYKTYTFRLRRGFRFSDGTPVRASAFAHAINRTLAPGVRSLGAQYTRDIVGAKDVLAGRTATARGVTATGNRLVVRFTRPMPDFPAQTTMPFFCAVPPTLPPDPEGRSAFPAAGPYYIAEYRRGQRVVINRNRFYGGRRPQHVDRYLVDLTANSPQEVLARIENGSADWGWVSGPVLSNASQRLARKYRLNRSQFFVKPGLQFRGYSLNTSRPLFRNNPRLRRAVNFAIDRSALRHAAGGVLASRLTDQYLPPALPGFRDARIYPLRRPNLRTARALARGQTRDGKAVLYTWDTPVTLAAAQIVKRDLAAIGLEVRVEGIPRPAYFNRVLAREAAFDIAFSPWTPDYLDPYSYVNLLLDGRFGTNISRFNSAKYNRSMRKAGRLKGRQRVRAYEKLDVQLARDAAPMVAVEYVNAATLVSKRVGCVVLRPTLDLTAVCLK